MKQDVQDKTPAFQRPILKILLHPVNPASDNQSPVREMPGKSVADTKVSNGISHILPDLVTRQKPTRK